MSNPFWDFSLEHYRLEGVAATCLELQDRYGLDVNLLLYGGWLATLDQRLEVDHLTALEALVAPWRETVVEPLRLLRRRWRDYPGAQALRDEVKALELRGERQQQDMMLSFYRRAGALPRAPGPLPENLRQVARSGCPDTDAWDDRIGRLAALLRR